MNRLTQLLGAQPVGEGTPVVFDGGMGTLLQERGLEGGGAGELWNIEHPDAIRKIHTEYAEAGARVLTTNTFGGTEPRLAMHGLGDRVYDINKAAAEIAHEVARQHGAYVGGDLGPTGELMFPMGTMDEEQASALFEAQLRGLVDGGIDLIIIETMSDLAEVRAAIAAAQKVAPELPIVATLSFDTNLHTMMGVAPAQAVTELAESGVDAVGANCGRGLAELESIMSAMVDVRPEGLLLIGQSNAGLPHLVGDHFVYDATVDDVAEHAVRLRDLGVDLIGSCCGSTPAFTAAIRDAVST
jgi:5-methyltetrahydrofolate--homocysteine methyltransferase